MGGAGARCHWLAYRGQYLPVHCCVAHGGRRDFQDTQLVDGARKHIAANLRAAVVEG
jgi:hypothetical protein